MNSVQEGSDESQSYRRREGGTMSAGSELQFKRTTLRDFSDDEYADRRARLVKAMTDAGLDAIIVNQEHDYRYFTGHESELWINSCRPIVTVFVADGSAHAVAVGFEAGRIEDAAYQLEVTAYGGTGVTFDPMFDTLAPVLTDRLPSNARVGFEGSSRLGYSIPELEMHRLRGLLPDATFVDASPLLWGVRLIKSEEEIEAVRIAAAVNSAAFDRLAGDRLLGLSAREIDHRFRSHLLAAGSEDFGYIAVMPNPVESSAGDVETWSHGPGVVRRNSPLFIDSGATIAGYLSDFNRYFVYGAAPQVAIDTLARLEEVHAIVYEEMRPGRTYAEAYRAVGMRTAAVLPDLIRPERSLLGRICHGIGQAMPEPPSLSPDDNDEIKAGTLMCVEPSIVVPNVGPLIVEEMVVVRDGGCELMSDGKGATIRQLD